MCAFLLREEIINAPIGEIETEEGDYYTVFRVTCPYCGKENVIAFWFWDTIRYPAKTDISEDDNICPKVDGRCVHFSSAFHMEPEDEDEEPEDDEVSFVFMRIVDLSYPYSLRESKGLGI